jgi:hypothetical protein
MDELLLPSAVDLPLFDMIKYEGLHDHIKCVGVVLYKKACLTLV